MRFSTPILAKDLKKELTSFGIKVLMCKQNNQNAVLAINSEEANYILFLSFCNLNNYAGVCGLDFRTKAHKNIGNIFKYREVC